MSALCNGEKSYGKTVLVPREIDLRRFPELPRTTKKFERLYKGRTSAERVNARLKISWEVDDGNLKGSRCFYAWVGAVLAVHAAFATLLAIAPSYEGGRSQGTLGKLGLSPIAQALRERAASSVTSPTASRCQTLCSNAVAGCADLSEPPCAVAESRSQALPSPHPTRYSAKRPALVRTTTQTPHPVDFSPFRNDHQQIRPA